MTSPVLDIRFLVEGIPVPKGSHQAFPIARGKCADCKPSRPCRARNCFGGTIVGTVVTDQQGSELEAWEALAKVRAMSARNVAGQRLVLRPGALAVFVVFVLPRPAGHWTDSGALSSVGRAHLLPTVKPDADKLMRALGDGMTGVLAEDDAQIIMPAPAKVYANWRGWTGAVVRARRISKYQAWVYEELAHHGVWTDPDAAQGALL